MELKIRRKKNKFIDRTDLPVVGVGLEQMGKGGTDLFLKKICKGNKGAVIDNCFET